MTTSAAASSYTTSWDVTSLSQIKSEDISAAAAILEAAPRVFVAGFRSCYAPAYLFHYLYRLFRPEVILLGAAGHLLDLELGGLQRDDAVVMICFEPYSRDLLLTARAAREVGCATIAVVDRTDSLIAEKAGLTLIHATGTPGLFPSLTACTVVLQTLAGLLYARSGEAGRTALRRAELRIDAHTAYVVNGETIHEPPRPSQPAKRPASRRRRRGDPAAPV